MTVQAILLPVFALVLLTFLLLGELGRRRSTALKTGETRVGAVALDEAAWPPGPTQCANAFRNQFEIPVLFYALVAFAMFTRKADLLFVILSWVFVVTRYVHAGVHITSNYVRHRFLAYAIGVFVLIVMWVIFAIQILFAV
jgi:hypothetical protein